MTDKPEIVGYLYEDTKLGNMFEDEPHEGFWFVPSTEHGQRSYIKGQPVIRLTDHEASRAADKARIAELLGLLREASDDRGEAEHFFGHALMYRIDAALAQQGKEGE